MRARVANPISDHNNTFVLICKISMQFKQGRAHKIYLSMSTAPLFVPFRVVHIHGLIFYHGYIFMQGINIYLQIVPSHINIIISKLIVP